MLRHSIKHLVHAAGLLGLILACEPMDRTDVGIDCTAESQVDFYLASPAESLSYQVQSVAIDWEVAPKPDENFFCFADPTLDGYPTTVPWPAIDRNPGAAASNAANCPLPPIEAIEGGPFCGGTDGTAVEADDGTVTPNSRHQYALHLQAGNHIFWGGEWRNWNMRVNGATTTIPGTRIDATTGAVIQVSPDGLPIPADGLAFWTKREYGSDDSILVAINDQNTYAVDNGDGTYSCTNAEATDPSQTAGQSGAVDPNLQTNNSTTDVVQDPAACENRWIGVVKADEQWALHFLPWSDFYQADVQPNRESAPFNPTQIRSLSFRFNRGQTISIWIDEMMLYREKE
jgi:hypothetical protein